MPMVVKVKKGAFLVISSLLYKSEMERKNMYFKYNNALNHTVLWCMSNGQGGAIDNIFRHSIDGVTV